MDQVGTGPGHGLVHIAMSATLLAKYRQLRDFRETSAATSNYNCIAWAAGDVTRWWWPDDQSQFYTSYWPDGVPRNETPQCFTVAFRQELGYEECADGALEPGVEKVAIYVNGRGQVTHMARQLESGLWTSKLGRSVDIEHQRLSELEGDVEPEYGTATVYLRRRRT